MAYTNPRIFALIGATCSGKSALSLQLAPLLNAFIFSLDSLCIYKEIDIASAKPSADELAQIKHFAINVLSPNEHVSANTFLKLLHESITICKNMQKNLLLVGGSSFYLKAIIQGLSPMPDIKLHGNKEFCNLMAQPLQVQYDFLLQIDRIHAATIKPSDTYRIQKALEIFFQTSLTPTHFFKQNPPIPFFLPIHIYSLIVPSEILHANIAKRTHAMIENGILSEAKHLLESYGDSIQPFKSIGLKECLMVLENRLALKDLESHIALHTRQLAKRQGTFNRTQFANITQVYYPFSAIQMAGEMQNYAE